MFVHGYLEEDKVDDKRGSRVRRWGRTGIVGGALAQA
jgi:hypothetical protein